MNKLKKSGVIYILTNPSFPKFVKIGYAHDIEARLKQLNRSETTPFAFRVYAVYRVDSNLTDKELHKLIDQLNPDLRTIEEFDGKPRIREFYEMEAEEAYSLLESIAKISGTQDRLQRLKPEGHEIWDEKIAAEINESPRRSAFRFSENGIPIGSVLSYIEDDSIQPIVVDDRRIEYQGVTTSMSALAQSLKGFDHPVQGTLWFLYNGVRLTDVRDAKEQEKSKGE